MRLRPVALHKRLKVKFLGEDGLDSGGISKYVGIEDSIDLQYG